MSAVQEARGAEQMFVVAGQTKHWQTGMNMAHWGRRYVWYVRYASTNTGAERRRKEGAWRAADGGRQGVHCCTGTRKKHKKGKAEEEESVETSTTLTLRVIFPHNKPATWHLQNHLGCILNPDISSVGLSTCLEGKQKTRQLQERLSGGRASNSP